jgi:hypothetical protein
MTVITAAASLVLPIPPGPVRVTRRCSRKETAYRVVERILERGYYVNPAIFPSVSMNRAGVRFAVTCHHTPADIAGLVSSIKMVLEEELERHGETLEDVRKTFRINARGKAAA